MTVSVAGVIVSVLPGEAQRVIAVGRERALGDRIGAAGYRLAGCPGELARQRRRGGVVDRHPVDCGVDKSSCGVGQGGVGDSVDLGLRIGRHGQSRRGDGERAAGEAHRVIAVGGERALGDCVNPHLLARCRAELRRVRVPLSTAAAVSSIATPSTVVSMSPVGVTVKAGSAVP